MKWAILTVTERVVGRQRAGNHKKATSWLSNDVREAVKRKKWLYRKALKDHKSGKLYNEAKKNTKQVVQEGQRRKIWLERAEEDPAKGLPW